MVAGILAAGGVHAGKAAARPIVNVSTAGVGAPVVSVVEDTTSLVASLLAILAPLLLVVVVVVLALVLSVVVAAPGRAAVGPQRCGVTQPRTRMFDDAALVGAVGPGQLGEPHEQVARRDRRGTRRTSESPAPVTSAIDVHLRGALAGRRLARSEMSRAVADQRRARRPDTGRGAPRSTSSPTPGLPDRSAVL